MIAAGLCTFPTWLLGHFLPGEIESGTNIVRCWAAAYSGLFCKWAGDSRVIAIKTLVQTFNNHIHGHLPDYSELWLGHIKEFKPV